MRLALVIVHFTHVTPLNPRIKVVMARDFSPPHL